VLAPFGDADAFVHALLEAAGQPAALPAMRVAARRTAESLSWGRVIQGVEERLLEVLRSRQEAPASPAVQALGHAPSRNGA
jgi:glycosyltransferase involved in cell wall biosynthesis